MQTDASRPREGRRAVPIGAVLVVLVAVAGAAGLAVGAVAVPLGEVGRALVAHGGTDLFGQIVWEVRLPRVLLAAVVGAGLAVSGAVIQTVVRNPLGDPSLIGITPGASLGAVLVIVLGAGQGVSLPAAAFLGAATAFALVLGLSRGASGWSSSRLILAGVAIGYLVSAATYFLQTIATPNQVQRVLFWSLGSVGGASWSTLPLPVAVIAAVCLLLLLRAETLNALAAGEELATSLGVRVPRAQWVLLVAVAAATGVAVSVAGGIAFVGLVVPHLARLLVGADHRRMLPVVLLLGALTLLLSDLVARVVLAPAELPIGVVTAGLGAPFFLWFLLKPDRRAV